MMKVARLLILALALAACSAAPAVTPDDPPLVSREPPTPTATAPLKRVFAVDTEVSVMRYRATGQGALGVIHIPGTFKLAGQDVVLTPEGNGYWLDVALVVDGETATAPNGLFLNVLRTALEIERYPTAVFTGRSETPIRLDGEPVDFVVTGSLELHGQTRPLAMPLAMTYAGGVLRATGEVMLDLRDFEAHVPDAIMASQIVFAADITSREVAQPR
ncbi:MAG: YceI family protein [Anaerolineales bacterium]|nr:YceI family protein [Anaerolineales bacterium]